MLCYCSCHRIESSCLFSVIVELSYSMVRIFIFIWPVCSELSVGRQLYHYATKTIFSLCGVYLQQGHCEGHRVQSH